MSRNVKLCNKNVQKCAKASRNVKKGAYIIYGWPFSDQVEQKDNVIREQAVHLDEYRMEILHLRGENLSEKPYNLSEQAMHKSLMRKKAGKTTQLEESEESKMVQSNAKALSEEDSSWSEPGNQI